MKHPTTSFEISLKDLQNYTQNRLFYQSLFICFLCTEKTHYLCKSSAQKKGQNRTFIPFKFQTIGNQLV